MKLKRHSSSKHNGSAPMNARASTVHRPRMRLASPASVNQGVVIVSEDMRCEIRRTEACELGHVEEPGTLTQGAPVFPGSSRLRIEPKLKGGWCKTEPPVWGIHIVKYVRGVRTGLLRVGFRV
jgi:hypothetical protein